MSNLEAMVSKIIENAKNDASRIIAEAKEEQQRRIQSKVAEATESRNVTVQRAKNEALQLEERAVASEELKSRDAVLKAKQQVLDRVFEQAKEEMRNLDSRKYTSFVKKTIEGLELSEEATLIVSKKYKDAVSTLNLPVKLSEDRFVSSGFIVETATTSLNYVFEDLIEYNREDLESGVIAKLFAE